MPAGRGLPRAPTALGSPVPADAPRGAGAAAATPAAAAGPRRGLREAWAADLARRAPPGDGPVAAPANARAAPGKRAGPVAACAISHAAPGGRKDRGPAAAGHCPAGAAGFGAPPPRCCPAPRPGCSEALGLEACPPWSPNHTPLALGSQSAGSGTSAGVAGAARRPRAASWTCTRSPSDTRLRRLKVRPCHVTLETSAKRSSFAMSSTACGKPAGGLSPAARRTAGPPRRRARIDLLIPRVSNPGGARGNPGGGSGHAGSRGPPPPAPSPAVAGRPPARGEGRGLPCADGTALSSPCPCAAAGKAAGDGADLRVRRRRGAVGMRVLPEGGPRSLLSSHRYGGGVALWHGSAWRLVQQAEKRRSCLRS